MKVLLFLLALTLFIFPVTDIYACKMTPIAYESRSLAKAYEKLMESEGGKDLKTRKIARKDSSWLIEMEDGQKHCHAFLVKVSMPGADCSMRAELSKQKECSL